MADEVKTKPKPKRKPRGNGTPPGMIKNHIANIPESDMSRIIRESFQYFNRTLVKSDEECAERLNDYFKQCNEEGQMPTVEDMALALGTTRQSIWEWENGQSCSRDRTYMVKKAKAIIAGIDAKLASEGKIPQVVYIFRAKNFYGMKDQQDVIVTPNTDPLGDRRSGAELTQKYIDSVKGIEQKDAEGAEEPDSEIVN